MMMDALVRLAIGLSVAAAALWPASGPRGESDAAPSRASVVYHVIYVDHNDHESGRDAAAFARLVVRNRHDQRLTVLRDRVHVPRSGQEPCADVVQDCDIVEVTEVMSPREGYDRFRLTITIRSKALIVNHDTDHDIQCDFAVGASEERIARCRDRSHRQLWLWAVEHHRSKHRDDM